MGWKEEEEKVDLMITMMTQRGSLVQTGLVVWDELKWGEDMKEGGEDNLVHQHVRGISLPKQDKACWAPFLLAILIQPVSYFIVYRLIYFCVVYC